MSKYNVFVETEDQLIPQYIQKSYSAIPSGAYSPWIDSNTGKLIFDKINLQCDQILDLPSKEYDYVVKQMQHFLKPSTKQKYTENGFIYKRSLLLHGKPGTGKTVIVNRVTQEALKHGATVLFNPHPNQLTQFYKALDDTDPNQLTVVIFEEFDELLQISAIENELLSILDGEVQKNNVIYIATTNYINKIPVRFQRPGRFSAIIEVDYPTAQAREMYLTYKKVNTELVKPWADKTAGFSIDELKETVLAVKCLDEKLDDVVTRLKDLKAQGLVPDQKQYLDEEDSPLDWSSNHLKAALKQAEKQLRRR